MTTSYLLVVVLCGIAIWALWEGDDDDHDECG